MIKRELWEIVRADELKVGDVINRHGDPELPETVLEINRIPGHVLIQTDGVFAKLGLHSKLFRRLPDTDDPRVLKRAILLMEKSWLQGFGIRNTKYYIDQARRELESDGNRDQAN